MLNIVRRNKLTLLFSLFAIYAFVAGMVHPVTPAFIEYINAGTSVYGLAFTAMAVGQFAFSPFWGKFGDKIGYAKCISIGFILYGISALVFGSANSWHFVILGRFLGGIGISGVVVSCMAFIISLDCPVEDRNQLLILYASIQSIGPSLGFVLGGFLGDINLLYPFFVQGTSLIISGLIFFFFVREPSNFVKSSDKLKLSQVNPFTNIIQSAKLINLTVGVFLFSIFLCVLAASGFDQSFNYFLRAKFNFNPSSSGLFKAAVAGLALTANLTINVWIVRKKHLSKSMCVATLLAATSIFLTMLSTGQTETLMFALCYYTCFAILSPLQQMIMTKNQSGASKGAVSGLFNAAKSFGMMTGPSFAGFVFDINPNISYFVFVICLIISAVLVFINYKMLDKQGLYDVKPIEQG